MDTYPEFDWDREKVDSNRLLDLGAAIDAVEVDEGWLDNVLLTGSTLEDGLGEPVASEGHGEGGRASSLFSLDDLVTAELDALDQVGVLVLWDRDLWLNQREQWNDGLAGMAANNWDSELLWVSVAGDFGDEGLGSDNVEGGDTKELLGVENIVLLQNLSGNWNSGVDWVGDDENERVWSILSNASNQVLDNASVNLEKIVSGHAWLSWDTSRNDNNVGTGERVLQTIVLWKMASNLALSADVAQVGSNTRRVDHIIQGEVVDIRGELQEQRKWLSNSTACTSNDCFNHFCL